MTCPSCTALAEQNLVMRNNLEKIACKEPHQIVDGYCCRAAKTLAALPILPSTDLQRARDQILIYAQNYAYAKDREESKHYKYKLLEAVGKYRAALAKVEGSPC